MSSIEEILTYWRIIKKRLWLIILLCGATVSTIIVTSFIADPVYQSSISFQVIAPPPAEVSVYRGYSGGQERTEMAYTRNNFVNILSSSSTAWDVVRELGVWDQVTGDQLKNSVSLEDIENSDLTRITVVVNDPQLAADLANKLFEVSLRKYGELLARSSKASREFISGQLEATGLELEQAKAALTDFQIENKVGTLNGSIESHQSLLRSLRLQRDERWAEGDTESATLYDQLIHERELELQNIINLTAEYETLRTTVDQIQSTYDLLQAKETEAKLKENESQSVGFIQRLSEAPVPEQPVSPIRPAVIALGSVISLTIGIMAAFIMEYAETYQASLKAASEDSKDATVAHALSN
jgi:uncharacterized protein involved in exopolysaccharide biosynthesis